MNSGVGSDNEAWQRLLAALDRAEKASAALSVRRTAAESPAPADSGELTALKAENEALSQRLRDAEQQTAQVRAEAARLAALADRALSKLDELREG